MLLHSKVHSVLNRKLPNGTNQPVDIVFVKSSTGEQVNALGIVLISSNKDNRTYTFRWPNGQIRTIKQLLIIKLNNHEIIFG